MPSPKNQLKTRTRRGTSRVFSTTEPKSETLLIYSIEQEVTFTVTADTLARA